MDNSTICVYMYIYMHMCNKEFYAMEILPIFHLKSVLDAAYS